MTMIEGRADRPPPEAPQSDPPPLPDGHRRPWRMAGTSVNGLTIAVRREAETAVLALAGDLDIASVPLLHRRLDDVATGSRCVVIDLSDLEFLDSTGLEHLLIAAQRLHRRGQDLVLRGPRPAVRRLFELTQTVERFRFED